MFILTYYDEKNCLITPIGKPFFELEKGQKLMENTVLQHLKKNGCENPEKLLQEAKKEKGFRLDPDNDIELYAESCIIYIKTESEEPFFSTFQIVNLATNPYFYTSPGPRKRNIQMESILTIFEPLLLIFASMDVVFSTKTGYTVLCIDPFEAEVLEAENINDPEQMAMYLLEALKYEYCFSLGINTLLPIESSGSLDELEYAMPHYQRAVYTAIFKKLQEKISSILSQPTIQVSHFVSLEDPLLIALYNFHRRLSIQHKIASTPDKKIYQDCRKELLEAYYQKYGSAYLGKFSANDMGTICYTRYEDVVEYDDYDFCIPYPDMNLLNLINQWNTTNSDKNVSLYYEIQERILSQKGLWINWERHDLRTAIK